MKVTVLPIHTFAHPLSITMREWESLGRLAVTLAPIFQYELESATFPALSIFPPEAPYSRWTSFLFDPHRNDGGPFARFVFDELRKAGLQPMEWLVWLAPVLPDKSFPERPEEYTVALRLRGEKSAAKLSAMGDDLSHKPTLSEQHEKT